MAATITKGTTHPDTNVSKNDFYKLVDDATITGIVNAEIKSDAAIADSKLATITTAGKVNLSSLVISGQTAGDILYSNDGTTFTRLPIGTVGQKLKYDYENDLLIHFDGADGSTDDYTAETGQTVSLEGNAQLDTAQKKFGTASLLLDGTGDYATVPDSADWTFGTGNFTIDVWVRFQALGEASYTIVSQYGDGTNYWEFAHDNSATTLRFLAYVGANDGHFTCAWSPVIDTWYHLAVVRSSTTCYIFIDGVSQSVSQVQPFDDIADIVGNLQIGYNAPTGYLNGWIDELRINKGRARWTASFTLPTAADAGSLIPRWL